jgi:eukaryotic-like serine/threonine-protein kinase
VIVGPGSTLGGRYRIDAELGAGGMGTVYRGHDLQLARDVAIKVVAPWVIQREGAIARFEREARVGAQLSHPHIVQTLDFGHADGVWYLVLQLVTGGDLAALLEHQHPLALPSVSRIGAQICDALVTAHASGIVHRDLKPENILVEATRPLHVRIADFGMAYLTAPIDPRDGRLTRDGELAGTPVYMSPEQIANHDVGPPADIYALGCMLFELTAGNPPFQGSAATLLTHHIYAPPPLLRSLRPDVPSGFEELVDRMLSKTASARPSAEAVRHRLVLVSDADAPPEERGKDVLASDRETRMISVQSPTQAPPSIASGSVYIGIAGDLGGDGITALRVAGFEIGPGAPSAWIAIGQPDAEIARLVATGLPVIAYCPRNDFDRISKLARLGVADVLLEPPVPHVLVRKVQRALHDQQRKQ